jgi:elongation factor P--(R)-beta-lysine ligase
MAAEDWRPTATAAALRMRAAAYAAIRGFFAERGVLEVETPMLSAAANLDPNIASFETRYGGPAAGGPPTRWLRTSPEFALKRLLAAGVGDCYELGRVFRDGEAGRRHNPEFSMLEWYRLGIDHVALTHEVEALVRAVTGEAGTVRRVERVGYRELYSRAFGFDPFTAPLEALQAPLASSSIAAEGLERDDWLDLLMTHRLQPAFAPDTLLFVIDYPPSQCALARIRGRGEDAVAERFEAYLGPHELANGYHELRDAAEQRARFAQELQRRRTRGLPLPPPDERLLAALAHGLPECAGVALGIERLLLALQGGGDIDSVLSFPFSRA